MKSNAPSINKKRSSWWWGSAVLLTAIAVDLIMRHWDVPFAARIVLSALPLVPMALFFLSLKRAMSAGDELETHVLREALVFVFFSLLGVFVIVDLLQNAGVLPDFTWNTMKLTLTMLALFTLGRWFANRRYR